MWIMNFLHNVLLMFMHIATIRILCTWSMTSLEEALIDASSNIGIPLLVQIVYFNFMKGMSNNIEILFIQNLRASSDFRCAKYLLNSLSLSLSLSLTHTHTHTTCNHLLGFTDVLGNPSAKNIKFGCINKIVLGLSVG